MVPPGDPIRHVLGLTKKGLEDVLAGKQELHGATGPRALQLALDAIRLPEEVERLHNEVHTSRGARRDLAVRKLKVLDRTQALGIHPRDWMITKVPVLPPLFRPVSVMGSSGRPLVADANYLYSELLDAGKNLKALRGVVDDVSTERLNLYHSLKAVTGLGEPVSPRNQERKVKGILRQVLGDSSKFGVVQRKLLGTPVDVVGRAVITPNPDYDMDTVGLPEKKAWEVYAPFVIRRMARSGVNPLRAAELVRGKNPMARKALVDEMDDRPVYLTRAPVLHRYGVMAFKPRLVDSDTMQMSPLCPEALNSQSQPRRVESCIWQVMSKWRSCGMVAVDSVFLSV